jgi:hypothetical protein
MDKLFVYVDGGARAEPGEAGIGIAITDALGNVVDEISELIGRSTTEVAEYRALIEGCRRALTYKPQSVVFFTDNHGCEPHQRVFETRSRTSKSRRARGHPQPAAAVAGEPDRRAGSLRALGSSRRRSTATSAQMSRERLELCSCPTRHLDEEG